MKNASELPVPDDVRSDINSIEILRAWNANGQLICSLKPLQWEDSSAWGIVLADAARHVANAVRDERGDEVAETLAKIRHMFNLELADPTDEPTGTFQE